jgi:tRNA dimethylallyltransferase
MVEKGLIEETESLLAKGYSQDLKPMQSLGYRHAIGFLTKKWTLDETVEHLQRDTRRYAKRQLTWFRADPEAIWLQPDRRNDLSERVEAFLAGRESER